MVTLIIYISLSILAQCHMLSYLSNKEQKNLQVRSGRTRDSPPPLNVASGQLHELYPRTNDDSTSLLHIARKAAAGFHFSQKRGRRISFSQCNNFIFLVSFSTLLL